MHSTAVRFLVRFKQTKNTKLVFKMYAMYKIFQLDYILKCPIRFIEYTGCNEQWNEEKENTHVFLKCEI